MKPVPQVGDIWKWTSEDNNFTYVMLLEDKGRCYRDAGYDEVITFTGLQIYGEGWHKRETGDIDDWDFADQLNGGWEFIA